LVGRTEIRTTRTAGVLVHRRRPRMKIFGLREGLAD
jgi:hypothetical protein